MRFIYKMLIGMILFNAMLVIFSSFFPMYPSNAGTDVTDNEAYTEYSGIGTNIFSNMYTNAVATGGIVFGGSILVGIFTGSLNLWVGIGAVVSIFVGMWNISWGVLQRLTSSYPMVNELVVVMSIIIGILVVFSIAEILTAQKGVD